LRITLNNNWRASTLYSENYSHSSCFCISRSLMLWKTVDTIYENRECDIIKMRDVNCNFSLSLSSLSYIFSSNKLSTAFIKVAFSYDSHFGYCSLFFHIKINNSGAKIVIQRSHSWWSWFNKQSRYKDRIYR